MPSATLSYFSRDGLLLFSQSYETNATCLGDICREVRTMMDVRSLPGFINPQPQVAVEVCRNGNHTLQRMLLIPDNWLTSGRAASQIPVPTTNEVLDKATAITQQANTLCETLVCTALSLHGVMGFKGDIGREHQRAASTTGFLKSAILSNLCLRQYTATGDELAIIQCLIPLFKDK